MSPFSDYLRELRLQREIRQTELAKLMGVEQGYISALELNKKGPPPSEFIDKLISILNLTSQDAAQLKEFADASERKLVLEPHASKDAYWLMSDLRDCLPELTKAEIEVIRRVLALKKDRYKTSASELLWQQKHRVSEEAIM